MAQSGPGKIYVFDDFVGAEWPVARTDTTGRVGPYRVVGETLADTDSGVVILEADGLSGVAQITTPNGTDNDSIGLVTATMWDVALMGTLVAETRVRFADLDTKEFFFGFSDVNDDTVGLEGKIIHGATTTITLTASDLVGFLLSSELTDDEDWHMVYNGGTTTGETTSTALDADEDAVAGEWQQLRLEVDNNGTVRWYIDGDLKQTVAGAVSTTTDLAGQVILEIKGTGAVETAELDYLMFKGNRDWTK